MGTKPGAPGGALLRGLLAEAEPHLLTVYVMWRREACEHPDDADLAAKQSEVANLIARVQAALTDAPPRQSGQ